MVESATVNRREENTTGRVRWVWKRMLFLDGLGANLEAHIQGAHL